MKLVIIKINLIYKEIIFMKLLKLIKLKKDLTLKNTLNGKMNKEKNFINNLTLISLMKKVSTLSRILIIKITININNYTL
jgi:hypothetical protein